MAMIDNSAELRRINLLDVDLIWFKFGLILSIFQTIPVDCEHAISHNWPTKGKQCHRFKLSAGKTWQ